MVRLVSKGRCIAFLGVSSKIPQKTFLNCFCLQELNGSNPGKGRKEAKGWRKMAPKASVTKVQQPEPQHSTPLDIGEADG